RGARAGRAPRSHVAGRARPGGRRRDLQAAATPRGVRCTAHDRVGQDPEARDPPSPRGARSMSEVAANPDRVIVERAPLDGTGHMAATLVLNRHEQLNAIDWPMLDALDAALDDVAADPAIRGVLVTGAGRAFSAGGDLVGYQTLQRDRERFPRFVAELHRIFGRLRTLPVPAVGLVNGVAAAGGLELLLNCDFALAARSARIGDAHLNFGQMGGGGALTLLPRAVGRARAAELVFTGRF